MKHILIQLQIQNGEYRYKYLSVHAVNDKLNVPVFADQVASEFYGGEPFEDRSAYQSAYYFYGGEVAVSVQRVQEINEIEFEILNKYLNQ